MTLKTLADVGSVAAGSGGQNVSSDLLLPQLLFFVPVLLYAIVFLIEVPVGYTAVGSSLSGNHARSDSSRQYA